MLLEMAADAAGDRAAVGPRDGGLTYGELLERCPPGGVVAARSQASQRRRWSMLNSEAVPVAAVRRRAGRRAVRAGQLPAGRRAAAAPSSPARRPPLAVVDADVADRVGRRRRGRAADARQLRAIARSPTSAEDERRARRSRRHRRPAVHQRHDRRAEGGGAAPPPPHVVHPRRPSSSSAPTRTRPRSSACRRTTWPASRPSSARSFAGRRIVLPPGVRRRRRGCEAAADEAITHAMVVPTMLGRILDVLERDRRDAARAAPPLLRRRADAGAGDRAGDGAAAPRRLRQRLRADRDQLDDLPCSAPTTTARPSRATTRRCARRLGSVGRPLPTRRARDPRRRRAAGAAGRAGEICVRGEQVAGEYLGASVLTRRRLVPDQRRRLPRRRRATSSSRAASTTSSCAAPRTSRPARSRTCSCPPGRRRGRRGRRARHRVGREGRRRGRAATRARSRDRGRAAGTGCASACARRRRPSAIDFRAELPLQRDRQAAAPRAQGRARRRRVSDGHVGRPGSGHERGGRKFAS